MTPDNKSNVNSDGIDLLDKLLRYNHLDRLTASEALAHSFFSTYTFILSFTATPYCLRDTSVFPPPHIQWWYCAGADECLATPFRRACPDAVRLETPSNPAECVSDSGFYST